MQERLKYAGASPAVFRTMVQLQKQLNECGLELSLIELVKVRASQINGCAFCIQHHTKDALAAGESAARLFQLDAWPDSPVFTPRERAALALTEAVTRITDGHVPDAVYAEARAQFDDKALVDLVFVITTINAWNRVSITFRTPPDV